MRAILDAPKWPLVLGTIFVLSGLLILFTGPPEISLVRKLLGALVSEIGFAFFIAFVLHATLEYHSRSETEKQISRGIISYIYQADLDNRMFFATEEHIFRAKFSRRSLDIEYDFVALKNDKVLVKYSFTYEIVNISQNSETYPIRTFIEKATDSCGRSIFAEQTSLGLQRLSIDGRALSRREIEKADQALADDDDFIRCSHPLILSPGQKAKIEAVHMIEKCARDSELWRSLIPCSDLTLRLRWLPDMKLKFRAQPVHPADRFDSISTDDHSIKATLNKPFFPQNGVHFWWGPAAPDLTGSATTPTPNAPSH